MKPVILEEGFDGVEGVLRIVPTQIVHQPGRW